jgi:hypothetical protein
VKEEIEVAKKNSAREDCTQMVRAIWQSLLLL